MVSSSDLPQTIQPPTPISLLNFYSTKINTGILFVLISLVGLQVATHFTPILSIRATQYGAKGKNESVISEGLAVDFVLLELLNQSRVIGAPMFATLVGLASIATPVTILTVLLLVWLVPMVSHTRSVLLRWIQRSIKFILFTPLSLFVLQGTFQVPRTSSVLSTGDANSTEIADVLFLFRPAIGSIIIYVAAFSMMVFSQWLFDAHYRAECYRNFPDSDRARPEFGCQLLGINRLHFDKSLGLNFKSKPDAVEELEYLANGRSLLNRVVFFRARSEFACTKLGQTVAAVLALLCAIAMISGWIMDGITIEIEANLTYSLNTTIPSTQLSGEPPTVPFGYTPGFRASIPSIGQLVFEGSEAWQDSDFPVAVFNAILFYLVGIVVPLLCLLLYMLCFFIPVFVWYPAYEWVSRKCFFKCRQASRGIESWNMDDGSSTSLGRGKHVEAPILGGNELSAFQVANPGVLKRMYEATHFFSFFAAPDMVLLSIFASMDWNDDAVVAALAEPNGTVSVQRNVHILAGTWLFLAGVVLLWMYEYTFMYSSRRMFRMHMGGVEKRTYKNGMVTWRSRQEGLLVGILYKLKLMTKLRNAKKKSVWELSFDLGGKGSQRVKSQSQKHGALSNSIERISSSDESRQEDI